MKIMQLIQTLMTATSEKDYKEMVKVMIELQD